MAEILRAAFSLLFVFISSPLITSLSPLLSHTVTHFQSFYICRLHRGSSKLVISLESLSNLEYPFCFDVSDS